MSLPVPQITSTIPGMFQVMRFPAGEFQVFIDEPAVEEYLQKVSKLSIRCNPVDIVISIDVPAGEIFSPRDVNSDLIVLALAANAFKNSKVCQEESVTLHISLPYFPYARQDRVTRSGHSFSLEVACRLLSEVDPKYKVTMSTWDSHSAVGFDHVKGFGSIPASRLAELSDLVGEFIDFASLTATKTIYVVAPDHGALLRATQVRDLLRDYVGEDFLVEMVQAEKVRDPETGKILSYQLPIFSLEGAPVLVLDDIYDGGATFSILADALITANAGPSWLHTTHGIYSKGVEAACRNYSKVSCNHIAPCHLDRPDIEVTIKESVVPLYFVTPGG